MKVIPGIRGDGSRERKKKGNGGRGGSTSQDCSPPGCSLQTEAISQEPAPAAFLALLRAAPCPHSLPGDGCERTKRQTAGVGKALRPRFAVKGKQLRACRRQGGAWVGGAEPGGFPGKVGLSKGASANTQGPARGQESRSSHPPGLPAFHPWGEVGGS